MQGVKCIEELYEKGDENMKTCEECGKKLGVFEGYRHPTLGKKYLLCSPCFDQVSESVEQWGNFVLSNSPIIESIDNSTKFDWKNIAMRFNRIQNKLS